MKKELVLVTLLIVFTTASTFSRTNGRIQQKAGDTTVLSSPPQPIPAGEDTSGGTKNRRNQNPKPTPAEDPQRGPSTRTDSSGAGRTSRSAKYDPSKDTIVSKKVYYELIQVKKLHDQESLSELVEPGILPKALRWTFVFFAVLTLLFILRSKMSKKNSSKPAYTPVKPTEPKPAQEVVLTPEVAPTAANTLPTTLLTPVAPGAPEPLEDTPVTVNLNEPISPPAASADWLVASASVAGVSHIKKQIPCQDSHFVKLLNDNWGIAISCDGAGSAANSHLGSRFIAKTAIPREFLSLIQKTAWYKNGELPTETAWKSTAFEGIVAIYKSLQKYAEDEKLPFSSLACTVILTIFSKDGLVVTHIGDGRAAYCDAHGDWHAMMRPHKGEEANHTIFLTSLNWETQQFEMSGVSVPESRVVHEPVSAFVLMSDGCEMHSFECSHFDPDTDQWSDLNRPYPAFFKPLVARLRAVAKQDDKTILNPQWHSFLEKGTTGLRNEQDDKTMVLGVAI